MNGLKSEMDSCYEYSGKGNNMGQQIISSCLKFLADADNSDHECSSWMQVGTPKGVESLGSGT